MAIDARPDNPLAAEAERLGLAAINNRNRVRAWLNAQRRVTHAYRAILTDADGNLTADAKIVLNDLSNLARFRQRGAMTALDEAALRRDVAMQAMVTHILERLSFDEAKYARMARQLESST